MSDQADGLRRLVRGHAEPPTDAPRPAGAPRAEPPPRPRPAGLLAAIAARWGRRGRADYSA